MDPNQPGGKPPRDPGRGPGSGRELALFQDVLERLLAPDLGPLRDRTREIVDWVLEGYLSSGLPDKALAYDAARCAVRDALAGLRGLGPGRGTLRSERRVRLGRDLADLERALERMVEVIRSGT